MSNAGEIAKPERVRKWMRLHPDTIEQVSYWREKHELTEQEYLALAVEEKVARENGDFDVPVLGVQRLNELIDRVEGLTTSHVNLEKITVAGFESLLGMTRGDSYLMDEEDGELGGDVVEQPTLAGI